MWAAADIPSAAEKDGVFSLHRYVSIDSFCNLKSKVQRQAAAHKKVSACVQKEHPVLRDAPFG